MNLDQRRDRFSRYSLVENGRRREILKIIQGKLGLMDREYPDPILRFQREVSQEIKRDLSGVSLNRVKEASIYGYKPLR